MFVGAATRGRMRLPILQLAILLLIPCAKSVADLRSSQAYDSEVNKAISSRKQGQFQDAIKEWLKLLETSKAGKDKSLNLTCHKELGILYWNTGDLKESDASFKRALLLSRELHSREDEYFALKAVEIYELYKQGKQLRSEDKYDNSKDSFAKAIDISKTIASPDHQLKCQRQLSLVYFDLGDYEAFYALNKEGLSIAQYTNNKREQINFLNNLGIYFIKLEDYASALRYCEQALNKSTELNDVQGETYSLSNLGVIYQELGNYEKSLDCISKSLAIDKETNDHLQLSTDYLNRGVIFRKRGLLTEDQRDLDSALADFILSLSLARDTNDQRAQIAALNNIGSLFTDRDQFGAALEKFQEAYKLARKLQDNEKISRILNNLGILSYELGKPAEANRYFQQAIDIANENRDEQVLWEIYLERANSLIQEHNYKDAVDNYRKSISIVEGVRSSIDVEDLKASYLGTDKRLEAYQNLIDLLATLHKTAPAKGYDKEAFDYLERAKARAFLDGLEVAQVDISQGISPILANREKELMLDIARSYNKLLASGLSAEGREAISDRIKTSEDKLESLKREIRTTSPAYADLKYPQVITCKEVRERLVSPGVVFFAYAIGKQASHGFAISPLGLKVFDVPPRAILQQQVTAYRKVISDRQNRDFHLGRELYQELVAPGLDPSIKKLVIVPDDILNLLPFETLLTSPDPGSWLIRDYPVGYVPSLSSLRVLIQRHGNGGRPRKDLLAIGNPVYGFGDDGKPASPDSPVFYDLSSSSGVNLPALKFSGLEIENVSRLFPRSKVTVLERESATKRWLRSNPLSDYKIIHFAAHSVIDDKKPARSAIVLSYPKNQGGGGLLRTRDIYNLKLNADLVTLSACQTGLGQFIRGEGIEGLSRGFFYAGASSVLMSLWSVNDQATYLLMERFYRHLKAGESLMEALRDAQLEMIRSRSLSHPYYWAGFVLSGRTDARVFPGRHMSVVLLVVVVGLSTLIAFSIVLQKRRKF